MKKKIYVTGVAGLIGSNLSRVLLEKGYQVKGCDSLISGYIDNVPEGLDWDKIDILDNYHLKHSMKGYDTVVHCAALPYEGVSVFSPKLIAENIYSGTISVASAAIANGYQKFINCSSMARYGIGEYPPPFQETYKPLPQDPYGMAKVHAEQALELLSSIHGIKFYNAVPHNLIGRGQIYTDPFRNVAAIFTNKILRENKVIIYGDGQQKRSFSHVNTCLDAFIRLIEMDQFVSGETFNIGPDKNEITILELAQLVGKHCGTTPQTEFLPDRPQEVKEAFCSSTKAIELLDYYPNTYSNDEIIEDIIKWVKTRGPQPFKYHLDLEIVNDKTPKTWTKHLI